MLAGTGIREISYVACGLSPINIHFSDYPKSLISRINEVYVSFNKISLYRFSDIEKNIYFISNLLYLLQSHFLLC